MRYVSTRGVAPASSLRTALFDGLAPDGGLYVPERLDPLPRAWLAARHGAALTATAEGVLGPFVAGELDGSVLALLLRDALDFPIPLVALDDRLWALELFHGPTLAFKDVAARVMARLMCALYPADEQLTVLVATSGDTGSAVAHAFGGLPGTRVVVLYPYGQVSAIQEAQLTTCGIGDVRALAVHGTFDDCQRLVKEAFADRTLRADVRLTSANSINIGRLLPQIVPYFHAAGQLPAGGRPVVFSTPSGNFGHLTAGLMAKRLGLPVVRFVAATNVNDAVPRYLASGRFEPRASVPTIANAMDVGHPSNFERIRALYHDDVTAMRRDILGTRHEESAIRTTIREVHRHSGYLLDPHTAVGYLGLREALAQYPQASGVVMATAHPAKFADIVEPIVGVPVAMPERLAACLSRPKKFRHLEPHLPALVEILRGA